jgi:hypothetical protein
MVPSDERIMKTHRLQGSLIVLCAAVILAGCSSAAPKLSSSTGPTGKDGGSTRIDIKHGLDPDAAAIDTTPKDITVEDLLATKLPEDFKGNLEDYNDKRIGPFEKSTFRLKGTLKSVIHRKDGDFFLVIAGTSGKTAVVEIPDPKLTKGSPIQSQIESARNEVENKYHPTDTLTDHINEEVQVEGVGFYGTRKTKGGTGSHTEGRLMPGTGFKSGK